MNKALHEAELAGTHTASRPRDWRKAMSDNVALALLVYTGMQIFMTVGAMKQGVSSIVPYLALVVLVVILFLQTWRASIIPLLAVPVSIVGTFAVMHMFGFSLNTLSLFGLVLSIGIVVDDAIVVVENVERHMALGESPKDAAR